MEYDFNKREDIDYSHSYDYLGGVGLGRPEVELERARLAKLGTYDLEPVDSPTEDWEKDEIVRIAKLVNKSKERDSLLKKIGEIRDRKLEFAWNKLHQHYSYFQWALHCLDREVKNWEKIKKPRGGAHETRPSQQTRVPVVVRDGVIVSGIQARPELNGKFGTVLSESGDRWLVEFADVMQTVSVKKVNCMKGKYVPPKSTEELPRALKVEIVKLTSEQGKLLNGKIGYILEYSQDSARYTVRLEESSERKLVKLENLHVPVGPGWEQRFDESTGVPFFVNLASGEVSWKHPILSGRKRSEIEREESEGEEFDRSEFLRQEEKRLKLDKREKLRGVREGDIASQLERLRVQLEVPLPGESVLFTGTPQMLLKRISASSWDERKQLLTIALSLILEDYKALKFNRSQLMALCSKIEEIEEAGQIPAEVESWIVAALQIAIPISYVLR